MFTHYKALTDTAAGFLGKLRQKRKPWVTPVILDLCDQRRDLKEKRGGLEGAKDYREITKTKIVEETLVEGGSMPKKSNGKKAYQIVNDLTTEKKGWSAKSRKSFE